MASLREDYERCLSANAASQRDLQENLISSKHELLRVQEQLALAEKVRYWCCTAIQTFNVGRFSFAVFVMFPCVVCSGVGEKVPADCCLSEHERDPNKEE